MSQTSKWIIVLKLLLFEAKVTSVLLSIQLDSTHIMERGKRETQESKDLPKLVEDILETIIQTFAELSKTMTKGNLRSIFKYLTKYRALE
jgi:hypothetical protein